MSRAEELFERLEREGKPPVDTLIEAALAENLWLDFKRATNDARGTKLGDSDWKNYAKALSGFANSDGGVIIWGVDCAPDPAVGDVPSGTTPLENPRRFVSWLENATSACTIPAVPFVRHHAILDGPTSGYVCSLIPASPLAPHQCIKPSGTQQYYMRAGSSFVGVPHQVLAGMFGRRPQPNVFHTFQGDVRLDRRNGKMWLVLDTFVHAYNKGAVVARDVFMNILLGIPGGGSTGSFHPDPNATGNWITQVEFGVLASAISTESYRLAPQVFVRVFRIHIELVEPFESSFGFRVTVGCDGAPINTSDVAYEPAELHAKYTEALGMLLENRPNSKDTIFATFFGARPNAA